MKLKLFLYSTILIVELSFSQTSTQKIIPKLSALSHVTIEARVKASKIKDEIFQAETDKFGRILSVKGKSAELKTLFYRLNFVPYKNSASELIPVIYTLIIEDEKIKGVYILNQQKDTIYSQLNNVVQLAFLMSETEYSEAITLFAKGRRDYLYTLKSDEKLFSIWTKAWTFDDPKLDRYTKRIISGRGKFILEEGDWKIDEN